MQSRPASAGPAHSPVVVAMDAAGPQVWEDMTVEVALSVMAAARTGHLVVCDDDGLRVGLVTQARLIGVRDSSGYTDRVRLRDITDCGGPFASPLATRAEAEDTMSYGRHGRLPVVGKHGSTVGVLALSP
ncbi:CBS domain-containing protein [Streptomyces sp. NBC_00076]